MAGGELCSEISIEAAAASAKSGNIGHDLAAASKRT